MKASAFDMMMATSKVRFLPEKLNSNINKKHKLKNDIIEWLRKNKVGWSAWCVKTSGADFLIDLSDVFWNLDGYHEQLAQRSHGLPAELQHFIRYNCPEKSGHRKRSYSDALVFDMLSPQLREYSRKILNLCGLPYMKTRAWKLIRAVLLKFAINLRDHASYLDKNCEYMTEKQSKIRNFAFESKRWIDRSQPNIKH